MEKPIMGTQTMVVSPHYLASAAGARMLERGGNAYDAAIAVSACLAVVYPHMTGLGGDSFWLSYHSKEGKVRAYNGSGRSSYGACIDAFEGESFIPVRGVRSAITVPGMVDAWAAIHEEYGRLSFAEVLQPAIQYAVDGFPMSKDQYENTVLNESVLLQSSTASGIYLPGGKATAIGQRFVQAGLADSLKQVAAGGRDAFYKGAIAEEIVRFVRSEGGLLTRDDLADHRGNWVEPIVGSYRGHSIYQLPPNSQGFVGIMALQVLDKFDFNTIEHGSYNYYHLMIEALKLSFRDRNKYLTDPEFSAVPLDRLLSEAYAAELAGSIRMDKACDISTKAVGSDTAYAAVVDGEGNAVSFIQSLYFEFGSGVVAGNTGILLQNRGSFFSLDPNHVNSLQPHKRTFHTLMPAMACLDGKPRYLYGTQGGEGQPQTQTALLTRMIDYGMNPQQAINEPRWVWGRTWGKPTQELKLEGRIHPQVADLLSRSGHLVHVRDDFDGIMGHAHAISIAPGGFLTGGTDPRCDGAAIGW